MKRGFLNKVNKTTSKPASLVKTSIEPVKSKSNDTVSTAATQVKSTYGPECGIQANGYLMLCIAKFPGPSPLRPNEPVTTSLLHAGTKEALWNLPDFLKPLNSPPSAGWPFIIKDVPNMGKGLYARETIQPGELIFTERPLVLIPVALPYIPGQSPHPDQFFEQLLERLDDGARRDFYSLHNCKGSSVSQLRGILDTNMLNVGFLPGPYAGLHGAVCSVISRVNHSCSPNADYHFKTNSMSFSIYALRTIGQGEQIFISYAQTLCSRNERQSELLTKYSFACKCSSCSLSNVESMRSDVRRSLLLTASQQIDLSPADRLKSVRDWASDPSLPNDHIIKPSQRIIDMMEEEGLCEKSLVLLNCARLCAAYCALGDKQAVAQWATRRKASFLAATFNEDVSGWKELAKAPEGSPLWKLRTMSARRPT